MSNFLKIVQACVGKCEIEAIVVFKFADSSQDIACC